MPTMPTTHNNGNVITNHPQPLMSAQDMKTMCQMCHIVWTVTTHAVVTVQADQGPRHCLRHGNNSTMRHDNNRARPQQHDTNRDEDGATSQRNHNCPPTSMTAHEDNHP
ncbi:uncharacterized protein LACBIDRAFT_328510 [Laccaria bicolor S238N-H82]|uniref:Predicted protein n=1 Tax=Laccaria bicolor (strain S238N-H82 / ATCC MYA-4686) TaxID=486041 RepID=B0DF28_LACBS|nr:uncharacterized protein LACBIDRAFT_328510 [Laccaria bicolor S238N-H82]EDR06646.1 predicted protein [Laccaria bicolor S238N-H82]|eukprot:XP_001882493.1 predicted protein [Laccaria bicolor S238N-H82]